MDTATCISFFLSPLLGFGSRRDWMELEEGAAAGEGLGLHASRGSCMPDGAPARRGGTLVWCLAVAMELAHRQAPSEPPAVAASPDRGRDGALSSVRIEFLPPSASGLCEVPCATGAEPQGPERGGQSEGGGRIRPLQWILRRQSRGAGLARDGGSRPRRRVRGYRIWGRATGGREVARARRSWHCSPWPRQRVRFCFSRGRA